jgi:sarcosine oxidase, subunit alpha
MTTFRTVSGGRIDRARPLRFSFNGRGYQGCAGDTLASALLANGVHLMGRSFKYHRPRGVLAAGADEPSALVTLIRDDARRTPNLRATQIELYDGLRAESQNHYPSLGFDLGAVNDVLAPLFPAGFYYKTFMWPAWAWHRVYEPVIRAAAGLGRAPPVPDPDRYAQRYAHCEVLVVGAGPAGLAAALGAAETGARVILCDEQAEMGGSLLAETTATIDGAPAREWLGATLGALARHPRVMLLPRTTAFGCYPHNMVGLAQRLTDHIADADPARARECLWQVRPRELVLATGALERPLVFPGNDRPGIMLAGAACTYLQRYGVLPGRRAVVVTAHDDAYRAAQVLREAGIDVAAVVDVRGGSGTIGTGAAFRGAGMTDGTGTIGNAGMTVDMATTGDTAGLRIIRGATIATTGRRKRVAWVKLDDGTTIPCDLVLMSGGFTPSVHLFSQARGMLRFDPDCQAFVPGGPLPHVRTVGACGGVFGLAAALADGAKPIPASTDDAGADRFNVVAPPSGKGGMLGAMQGGRGKAFVDFQNDVTAKDIALAVREGFRSIEHIKRYTTSGMATDQGKTANVNALGIAADALAMAPEQVGLTTFRPPYTPVTFGTFAGASRGTLFDPVRETPLHDRAVALGAVFEDVGQWRRAHYFPRAGETMHDAVARECRAVRDAAGIFDGSTLGKIEVVGPDAAEFLDRMYVNALRALPVGRCRYGILLREDGFVLDDGIIGRLAADRFHVTTTTGGAARVLAMMEDYLQTEWSDLEVWLTSVTEQWAVIAVQGPRARDVLAPLVRDIDLALPHMAVAEGRINGVPTRLFRVSFTGELGFEVNVPADAAGAVWDAIAASGITPYGTEAMHVLRAEKGYIIAGQEADGTATPDDLGLTWAIGKSKRDFVGKRSLLLPALAAAGRKQLVGLLTDDPRTVLEDGAQIVDDPRQAVPMRVLGHVTSSYMSSTLGRSIALGMLADGRARLGQQLFAPMADRAIGVRVVSPVLHDPQGTRLHG